MNHLLLLTKCDKYEFLIFGFVCLVPGAKNKYTVRVGGLVTLGFSKDFFYELMSLVRLVVHVMRMLMCDEYLFVMLKC